MIRAHDAEIQAFAVLDAELEPIYAKITEAAGDGEFCINIDAPLSTIITQPLRSRLDMLGFRMWCGDEKTCAYVDDDWKWHPEWLIFKIVWGDENTHFF